MLLHSNLIFIVNKYLKIVSHITVCNYTDNIIEHFYCCIFNFTKSTSIK
ncbi:hypothetical protein A1OE_276 [Candidatus Endolissoclinum faulkneri L2]|uniref:Uncharacterized protein n=1 Tax=Candidatus Endolissoclinum faulkneri L2 TaxID=1193729 RepID=K7ZCD7_9PROT|nr:hypothetical protein A1OE_276 [Candidatus Endolissoclinum faulkneri L2]